MKFHPFREARRDIELVQAIRHEFPHIDLMIDPVCAYTVPEALAVGRVLDDLNFFWFENPISDPPRSPHPRCLVNTPMTCLPNSATTRTPSPKCTPRALCDRID